MEPGEPVYVESPTVDCDGGGGPLCHPKVYLKIGDGGEIVCPYCSRRYILTTDAEPAADR